MWMMTTSEVADLTVFALNEIDKIGGKVGTVAILWCSEPDEDDKVVVHQLSNKTPQTAQMLMEGVPGNLESGHGGFWDHVFVTVEVFRLVAKTLWRIWKPGRMVKVVKNDSGAETR